MTARAASPLAAQASGNNGKRPRRRSRDGEAPPPLPEEADAPVAEPQATLATLATLATPAEGAPEALRLLREGASDTAALHGLREAGLTPGRAKKALARAYAELAEAFAARTDADRLARAVEQREVLIARAFEKSDLRIALSALDSRDKLLSLSPETVAGESSAATLLELAELARRAGNLTDPSGNGDA